METFSLRLLSGYSALLAGCLVLLSGCSGRMYWAGADVSLSVSLIADGLGIVPKICRGVLNLSERVTGIFSEERAMLYRGNFRV
jgi:hypothetical protein